MTRTLLTGERSAFKVSYGVPHRTLGAAVVFETGSFLVKVKKPPRLDPPNEAISLLDGYERTPDTLVDSRYYTALQYIEGASLHKVLNSEPFYMHSLSTSVLSDEEVFGQRLLFAKQTIGVVTAVAERGVIHRDIKPGNLLLGTEGNVHLIDLQLATTNDASEVPYKRAGTIAYMAREQLQGGISHRSDVFQLGSTLYQVLTGDSGTPIKHLSLSDDHQEYMAEYVISLLKPRLHKYPELMEFLSGMLKRLPEERTSMQQIRQDSKEVYNKTIEKIFPDTDSQSIENKLMQRAAHISQCHELVQNRNEGIKLINEYGGEIFTPWQKVA